MAKSSSEHVLATKDLSLPGLLKLNTENEAVEKVDLWRAQNLKIGFTNGFFDLLHPGHIALFEQAKKHCDRLIVAVNSDQSATKQSPIKTLVQDEMSRATLLGSLGAVDLVVPFHTETPMDLIKALKPDVLIKGNDYREEDILGGDWVKDNGGQTLLVDIDPKYNERINQFASKAEPLKKVG